MVILLITHPRGKREQTTSTKYHDIFKIINILEFGESKWNHRAKFREFWETKRFCVDNESNGRVKSILTDKHGQTYLTYLIKYHSIRPVGVVYVVCNIHDRTSPYIDINIHGSDDIYHRVQVQTAQHHKWRVEDEIHIVEVSGETVPGI